MVNLSFHSNNHYLCDFIHYLWIIILCYHCFHLWWLACCVSLIFFILGSVLKFCFLYHLFHVYQLKSPVNEWKFTNHFPMGSHSLDKQLIDDVSCFQSEIHLEKGKCVCECLSWGCDMILHNYIVCSFISHIWMGLLLNWLKLPFYSLFEFKLCFRNPALIRCFHTSFPKGIGKKRKSTGCRPGFPPTLSLALCHLFSSCQFLLFYMQLGEG